MSGGNCPETPRQKMIGMMYLLLTAMLALNVSGDLLNAYILVDKSILKSKESIEAKTGFLYADFNNEYELNKAKVEENWNKALQIQEKANFLNDYIQNLKILFVQTADGAEATPENYKSTSNTNVGAQLMLTEGNGRRSKELKDEITAYRDLLLSLVEEKDTTLRVTIEEALSVEASASNKNNPNASWESEKFEYIPMAASMALLSQIQSTVRNMESDVIRHLYTGIDAGSFKFNKVDALVIPTSNYVIAGDEYSAKIMIAARDTTQPPTVVVNGRNIDVDQTGVGILRMPTSSEGSFRWSGEISIIGPDGQPVSYPVNSDYIVAKPSVVISPVKMNVVYEGIENPIAVSVPGIPSENVSVSITNATSVKRGNEFIVTPKTGSAGGTATVSVIAKIGGRDQNMGKMDFRIKRVPDPVAKINNQREGKIAKAMLVNQMGIVADMEGFDFDLKFNVTSFKISTIKGGYVVDASSSNNMITAAQKELLSGTSRGQKVFIEDIVAVGPGGTRRTLGSIVLTVD